MKVKLPDGFKFESLADLKDKVSESYNAVLNAARKEIGRGCYRSRGKEVRGVDERGELVVCDYLWDGSLKDLLDSIESGNKKGAVELFLEGGVDYAEKVGDFWDGSYDPWVASWSVSFWAKPGFGGGDDA